MKDRSIAVTKTTVLLISLLGFSGLLISSEAHSALVSKGSGTKGAVATRGGTKHEGRHRRLAKGKSQHQKMIRGGEASTKGKVSPMAPGRGLPEKIVCAEAFDRAKETARDSHFRAAKEWFARCARSTCGRSLRQQCGSLHAQVVALLPSVVPVVTDAGGPATRDIAFKMDGETLTSKLDGTAIVVDPGDHEFTFVKEGEVFGVHRLAIEKGQRNQIVSASFQSRRHWSVAPSPTTVTEEEVAAPEADQTQMPDVVAEAVPIDEEPAPRVVHRVNPGRASVEAPRQTGAPWSAYALAGVGLLGVGGYGAFTLKGLADNDALVQLCKPDCKPTSVHHLRNLYLAADISLGVGIAALLASTYLFLHTDSGGETPPSRTRHINTLSVEPLSSGALASVGGTF